MTYIKTLLLRIYNYTVNVPVNVNPNLTASNGYNSMEDEYTSTTKSKIES